MSLSFPAKPAYGSAHRSSFFLALEAKMVVRLIIKRAYSFLVGYRVKFDIMSNLT